MPWRVPDWTVCTVFGLLVAHGLAVAGQPPAAAVCVLDTGRSSSTPLPGELLATRAGWTALPEDETTHRFAGDAVLANDRITVVFRRGGPGGELYAKGAERTVLRAMLVPTNGAVGASVRSCAVVENTSGGAALDVTFQMPASEDATLRFELSVGQVFLKTGARRGAERLRLESPCRFALLPDFFADDVAVDATELPVDRAELPSENFLLHMLGRGEAIVAAVCSQRDREIQVQVSGAGEARILQASEIPFGAQGNIYVAVLEGPDIWHWRDVQKTDADRVIALDWRAPFPAHWRIDWRQDDGLTDSWDLLVQQPDGNYAKLDWFGQPDNFGTLDWMRTDRKRWTTVLGWFSYPCWIDKDGRGFLQPLKKPGKFHGPAIIYPINRVTETPLTTFTFVDVVRSTLGVGPCQYVLDVEGQKKRSAGKPTCDVRTRLNAIYAEKQQKQKRADVEQSLEDVLAFVRHIRTRIDAYVTFGDETLAYLKTQQTTHPELAVFLAEMERLTRRIEDAVAKRIDAIGTPEYAASLVREFRTTLVDYEGNDALDKCQKITAAFVKIGGNQDELVGECRLAVRVLRQKAGLAMAIDPRTAAVGGEIRRRTQAILRNPTSYEAPRH